MSSIDVMKAEFQGMPGELRARINQTDISQMTAREVLNTIFEVWSWEIVNNFIHDDNSIIIHGRLTIPGLGVRDGIGQIHGVAYSAAVEEALADALQHFGIPNRLPKETASAPAQAPETPKAPVSQAVKKEASTASEKGSELKQAYDIQTRDQFVAFANIWNPDIQSFEQITEQVLHDLHAYVDKNPEEFEDFVASKY